MKVIGLLILIESGIEYKSVVSKRRRRREILRELINEYNRKVNNRIIKCFCFFINDEESITTMKHLCGNRILYEMLNYDCYYSKESKILLLK